MSEKFALKWNDYQSNWKSSLSELHKDTNFADVTLISDDKIKFSAHKVIVSSCSNMFKFILKENSNANPILYLGGVTCVNLGYILDYIYHGEVNLFQDQLDSFLESAQKLEIEGDTYKLTITPRLASRSFEPVNTNGAQRGWRPIVQLLDHRIQQASLLSGDDLGVVIADDFILVPNPRVVDLDRDYVIKFKAQRVD